MIWCVIFCVNVLVLIEEVYVLKKKFKLNEKWEVGLFM